MTEVGLTGTRPESMYSLSVRDGNFSSQDCMHLAGKMHNVLGVTRVGRPHVMAGGVHASK